MRVLTNPVEIRKFRKKQIKKIGRMFRASVARNTAKALYMLRECLIHTSICAAIFALWLFILALFVWSGNVFLEYCVTSW